MKKKDIYVQESSVSCGACSIASIVSHYDGYIPLEVILDDTETTKNGTNAYMIIETLKKYGFDSQGMKVDLEDIKNHTLPAIAHVIEEEMEHFLVIYEVKGDNILTMDPAHGKKWYKKEDFKSMYTGVIITSTPNKTIPKYKYSRSLLNLLVPLFKYIKWSIVLVFILSIVNLTINLGLGFHLKLLNIGNDPVQLSIVFILLQIIVNFLEYLKGSTLESIVKYIDQHSIENFTYHIFHLPERLIKNKRVGEIVHKIENMSSLKDLFLRITIELPIDFLSLIASFLVMFLMSSKLATIYILEMTIYTLFTILTYPIIYKEEKKIIRARDNYTGSLVEYLDGLESIKNLNGEEKFLSDLNNTFTAFTEKRWHKERKYRLILLVKRNIFGISSIVFNLVGFMLLSETFTFLDLLTIQAIFSIFYESCENILTTFVEVTKFKAIFRNISEFYDLELEKLEPTYKETFKSLEIENLTYSYDHIKNTIENFSYNLKKGEKVLIKGPSGIGKSTFVKCLSGLQNDYSGTITLNGVPINQISITSLRNYIVYIGQEETLFTKTIRDNITFGTYDERVFEHISQIALLDGIFANKRSGANTMLLEGASNLSGGERSRVILARALYKKPQILIIDETLSSISEKDENKILENLISMDDISLIYITHRNKDQFFKNIIEFRKDGTYAITKK